MDFAKAQYQHKLFESRGHRYTIEVSYYSKHSLYRKNSLSLYSDTFLCNFSNNLSFAQCVGKKTILIGESNVGKTELTAKFLSYIQNLHNFTMIYAFDMGPKRFSVNNTSIGGKLSDFSVISQLDSKIKFYSYPIIPPRSKSKSYAEVYQNCLRNYELINIEFNSVLDALFSSPSKQSALIINDLSIFLHLGSLKLLRKVLKTPTTIYANSYYGRILSEDYGSNISSREKRLVDVISRRFDYSIHLLN